jgi:hypothetical protein
MTWTLMGILIQLFPRHVNPSQRHWHCIQIKSTNLSLTILLRKPVMPVMPQIYLLLLLEEVMTIISETSDTNTSQSMERSYNEETEELKFDLVEGYVDEFPNHDHA